jgi:hypothetical protein
VGSHIEKIYVGPRRFDRARREHACLAGLAGHLPVPTVLGDDPTVPRLTLSVRPGDHGQDLIGRGSAAAVLRLVGATWAALQQVPMSVVPELTGNGSVIVHGDFGPQNLLFDLENERVTGVLDWEFAHRGRPVEDLAWAEWIVRMHHTDAIDDLGALYLGAGTRPRWEGRHDAMLRRVRALLTDAERTASPSPWRRRLELTERWVE